MESGLEVREGEGVLYFIREAGKLKGSSMPAKTGVGFLGVDEVKKEGIMSVVKECVNGNGVKNEVDVGR